MAYTIKLLQPNVGDLYVQSILQEYLERDGRFWCDVLCLPGALVLEKVRLKDPKEYCGQHPGPCQALFVRPKKKHRYLEWDDWVAFHELVNNALDGDGLKKDGTMKRGFKGRCPISADVWTNPRELMDKGNKMYVRRGLKRRVRYEWKEKARTFGGGFTRQVQVWNHGTEDQFAE